MTPQQIELIKQTWASVGPIADAVPEIFYNRLFEVDPSTKPLFANVDMTRQHTKLLEAIELVADCVDQFEQLAPALHDLGARHVRYGVADRHYDSVGAALIWTLEKGLGEGFTEEVREAWTTAYGHIASTMQQGATSAQAA